MIEINVNKRSSVARAVVSGREFEVSVPGAAVTLLARKMVKAGIGDQPVEVISAEDGSVKYRVGSLRRLTGLAEAA